jgi:hypothetical protein
MDSAEKRVDELNALLRGWSGYFNQGRVIRAYRVIQSVHRCAVCGDGCSDDKGSEAPGTANTRTSISMRRSASTASRQSCSRGESEGLRLMRESRMREICTSGSTSGSGPGD